MSEFIEFRHKRSGVVKSYPAHYGEHPVFGDDLEVYIPEEYEEDKVVVETHELPVDQRGTIVAEEKVEDDEEDELELVIDSILADNEKEK